MSRFGKILIISLFVLASSCGEDTKKLAAAADDPTNVNEIDAATVQNLALDAENGTLGSSTTQTSSSCSLSVARSSCTGATSTVLWSSCLLGAGSKTLVLSGGWTNTYDSSSTCSTVQGGSALPSGASVTRTSATGFTVALTNGVGLTSDTNARTTYSGVTLPSTGVTTTNNSGTKTIVINGVHRVLKTGGGTTIFDQSLSSSGVTVTGSLAGGNRVVNGTLTTYHDSAKYTSVSSFTNLTWGSTTCCFPTSGTISTVLSGAFTGTQSMTFTSTCGQATAVSTSGATSSITLSYCM